MQFLRNHKELLKKLDIKKVWKDHRGITLLEQVISMGLVSTLYACLAFTTSGVINNYIALQKCVKAINISDQIEDGINNLCLECDSWTIENGDFGNNVTINFEEGDSPLFYDGNFETFYVSRSLFAIGRPKVLDAISDRETYDDFYIIVSVSGLGSSGEGQANIYVVDDDPMFWDLGSFDSNRVAESSSVFFNLLNEQLKEHSCRSVHCVVKGINVINNSPAGPEQV